MKFFIALSAFLVVAVCKPSAILAPFALSATPVVAVSTPVQSQYHAQDGFGQYAYGYSNQLSAKNEVKSLDGSTVGAYSYVDPNGKLQTVQYSSDSINGFRAVASNLPVAPSVPVANAVVAPRPVQDTPEVLEARAKHLAVFEAIKNSGVNVAVPTNQFRSAAVTEASPSAVSKSAPTVSNARAEPAQNRTSTATGVLTPTIFSPAITAPFLTAPAVALRTSVPTTQFLAPPAFHSYSYGINTFPGVNAYIAPQPVLAYSTNFLTAPVQRPPSSNASSDAGVVIEAKKS